MLTVFLQELFKKCTRLTNEKGNASPLCGAFIAICLFFFAFSTIISWNLFGKKAAVLYSIFVITFTFLGAVLKNEFVWDLQDMFNPFMVLPNVLARIALSGMVTKALNKRDSGLGKC